MTITSQQALEAMRFFTEKVAERDFPIFMNILHIVLDADDLSQIDWLSLHRAVGRIKDGEIVLRISATAPSLIIIGAPADIANPPSNLRPHLHHLDLKAGLKLACMIDGAFTYVEEACNGLILTTWDQNGPVSHGDIAGSGLYRDAVTAGILHDLVPYLPLENFPKRRQGYPDRAAERSWWEHVRKNLLGS